jgi:predicted transcriptional regulator
VSHNEIGDMGSGNFSSGPGGNGPNQELLAFTARITAAYASRNTVPYETLPELLQSIHASLIGLGSLKSEDAADRRTPAVPVKQSVFPDYIICLEDGKHLVSLKRHLEKSFGLTPNEYRNRWGLPPTYPMVAPNYAAHRSTLAKASGLGRKRAGREADG